MFRLNDVVDFVKINKIKENKNINIYDCLNYFENPKIVEQNGIVCEKCEQGVFFKMEKYNFPLWKYYCA